MSEKRPFLFGTRGFFYYIFLYFLCFFFGWVMAKNKEKGE